MNPVQKALWYVESHSRMAIGLDQVAAASGVSPYHLTRAFATSLGTPLMRYVRQRRLTEAAKRLAEGAADILSVAIDHSYGSHEAFTRAFKDEFSVTPESVRAQRHLHNLQLTEPIAMKTSPQPALAKPRIEKLAATHFAGIVERYECDSPAGIPDQWQRFLQYFGRIRNQAGRDAYGICYNFGDDGRFDYMTAVEVAPNAQQPFGLVQLDLPAQKYAVFAHGGHVAEIRGVIAAIWSEGLSSAGLEPASGATLEKYGERFDPATGQGGFEIWVAVK